MRCAACARSGCRPEADEQQDQRTRRRSILTSKNRHFRPPRPIESSIRTRTVRFRAEGSARTSPVLDFASTWGSTQKGIHLRCARAGFHRGGAWSGFCFWNPLWRTLYKGQNRQYQWNDSAKYIWSELLEWPFYRREYPREYPLSCFGTVKQNGKRGT